MQTAQIQKIAQVLSGMKWQNGIKRFLFLVTLTLCIYEYVGFTHNESFQGWAKAFLSLQQSLLLFCAALWLAGFIWLSLRWSDVWLIGFLALSIFWFLIEETTASNQILVLFFAVLLGKGGIYSLDGSRRRTEKNRIAELKICLAGIIGLLVSTSMWHLDMSKNSYHGPRWTGLWDNPNLYGMLMGAGVVLAAGLLLADRRWQMEDGGSKNLKSETLKAEIEEETKNRKQKAESRNLSKNRKSEIGNRKLSIFLFIAAGMMAVGLLFSYSRGAWLATTIGLLYLAWCYGKLNWRWVLPGILIIAAVACIFWHSTADNGPWYLKRLDLSRPSAQHRVAAWKAAVHMMRDHPLGVGWNQAVSTYEKNYSSPEGGAAALTMNSYLMLGTELGLPGLLCFVAYVGLALKGESRKQKAENQNAKTGDSHCSVLTQPSSIFHPPSSNSLAVACRAGAVMLLVAFWFDGGLFDLPTAAVFWVLLELGAARAGKEDGRLMMDDGRKAA